MASNKYQDIMSKVKSMREASQIANPHSDKDGNYGGSPSKFSNYVKELSTKKLKGGLEHGIAGVLEGLDYSERAAKYKKWMDFNRSIEQKVQYELAKQEQLEKAKPFVRMAWDAQNDKNLSEQDRNDLVFKSASEALGIVDAANKGWTLHDAPGGKDYAVLVNRNTGERKVFDYNDLLGDEVREQRKQKLEQEKFEAQNVYNQQKLSQGERGLAIKDKAVDAISGIRNDRLDFQKKKEAIQQAGKKLQELDAHKEAATTIGKIEEIVKRNPAVVGSFFVTKAFSDNAADPSTLKAVMRKALTQQDINDFKLLKQRMNDLTGDQIKAMGAIANTVNAQLVEAGSSPDPSMSAPVILAALGDLKNKINGRYQTGYKMIKSVDQAFGENFAKDLKPSLFGVNGEEVIDDSMWDRSKNGENRKVSNEINPADYVGKKIIATSPDGEESRQFDSPTEEQVMWLLKNGANIDVME